jgi:putative Mg2+ transporter-C (MgtC) family protein
MEEISAPVTLLEAAFRLGLAILLGAAIGINRELLRKPAGLQTHSLVALGSALFAIVALELTVWPGDETACSRVIQGLIAGVGFIGAGAILRKEASHNVFGLTTASTIWVVAALGVAVGMGLWRTSLMAVGMSLAILFIFGFIDHLLERHDIGVDPEKLVDSVEEKD